MHRTIATAILVTLIISLTLPSVGLGQTKIDYSDFEKILKHHVKGKFVDYHALAESHDELDRFVGYLRHLPTAKVDSMSQDSRLAFWINAFNALTLKAIIEAWPVMSIQRIDGFREKLWTVAGRPTTLDNIRMKYIGQDIGDPRAYLATCDGTAGAFPLRPYLFKPDKIQEQLDQLSKEAVNDPGFTVLRAEENGIDINMNLYWFRKILLKKYPDPGRFINVNAEQAAILNFIEDHAEGVLKAELAQSDNWTLGTAPYLWLINSDKRPPVPINPDAPKKPAN